MLNRRAFLTAAGALVVAITTPAEWAEAAQFDSAAAAGVRPGKLSSYISVERDGTVFHPTAVDRVTQPRSHAYLQNVEVSGDELGFGEQ